MQDPLEAMKTFKGRWYGPYCAILGTEPFISDPLETRDEGQINTCILQFQKFLQGRHMPL